ncbi:RdgB/HAM1 family non-canonical purine NTP pyrophosphatase [Spongiibacter nanhainus]|uniref:dITP/XTP pyrophosphatase n=1 Tax=Spongiibacter nanhainus TaxID=2794344 RepID=A0A7T4R0Y3_9GAMM|nr:RdgB/HAM1 family non-canonical purine NTP pyrophosphatase [Spongiibacter nanhainus]QQD18414.1 RdgB/HAM1 family non-canonical purine NTP pyrophosphatase [Spongiibacter nanhainus]
MALKLVLASGNPGKLAELSDILADLDAEVLPQSEFDVPDAVEDGLSFVENALIKARHAARHSGLPALADDSGLCVDALGGAPGIYSARYAGTHGDDEANNRKLLANLTGVDNRRAHFHCALVFVRHENDPAPIICEGLWWGEIVDQARGDNGFGYDPLFYIPSLGCCSAELPKAQKNAVSHRGQALAKLLTRLQQR